MRQISDVEIERIHQLRRVGHSTPEIVRLVGRGYGTVFRYARSVRVAPEFAGLLKSKQGGSRARARRDWEQAKARSVEIVGKLSFRDRMLVLAALYWGEGTKRELNIINGDASLLRMFIVCLEALGIKRSSLRISLRLFEDIDVQRAKEYWARELRVRSNVISVSEFSKGKKNGKLAYGMCRIRVQKSGPCFKLVMSMIESLKRGIMPS